MTAPRNPYPERGADRTRWIQSLRPERSTVDLSRPAGAFVEEERSASGKLVPVATLLLTGAECPWRCLMCDLWKQTAPGPTPTGALVSQIDAGLAALSPARWLKLYNAGSFFDRFAVPAGDLPAIARCARRFERLIVECHPALVGERALRFRELLGSTALEVAMGLETIHPDVLPKLNKRMTPAGFSRAASLLVGAGVDVRAFVLAGLPFVSREESALWAKRSIDFAFGAGASVVSVIPTRPGNGAMDRLEREGLFVRPDLAMLEEVSAHGLGLRQGRLLVDMWEPGGLGTCAFCAGTRIARLTAQNLSQVVPAPVRCPLCRTGEGV